jgi:hypothetical protein
MTLRPNFAIGSTEPIVVSPRRARQMLDVGNTRIYELLKEHKLESYLDGRSRKITVESIRRYIAERLDEATKSDSHPHRE